MTWGQLANRYLFETDNRVALAQRSNDYRHECTKRGIKVWVTVFDQDLREQQVATDHARHCAAWARCLSGMHATTFNNTVATFKHILALAVEDGTLPVCRALQARLLCAAVENSGPPRSVELSGWLWLPELVLAREKWPEDRQHTT